MDEVYKLPKIAFPEVTGSTVSFYSEYDGLPLKKCEVAFAATQSGTGDPSPTNIRPIVGVNSVGVADSAADQEYYPVNKLIPIPAFQDGEGDPSPSNVRQILYGLSITRDDDSELEVYGGTLNVFSGELVIDWDKITITNDSSLTIFADNYLKSDACDCAYISDNIDVSRMVILSNYSKIISNYLQRTPRGTAIWSATGYPNCFTINNKQIHINIANDLLGITDYTQETRETALQKIKDYLSVNNFEILIPVTPTIIQLSATELQRAKEALGIATATIDLGGTYYGGTVDFVSGLMTVTHGYKEFDGSEDERWNPASLSSYTYFSIPKSNMVTSSDFIANTVKKAPAGQSNYIAYIGGSYFNVRYTDGMTIEQFRASLAQIPIEVVYPLAEPFDIQLTPAQIATIQGNNTIFADTGDTTVQYIRVY